MNFLTLIIFCMMRGESWQQKLSCKDKVLTKPELLADLEAPCGSRAVSKWVSV